MPRSVQDAMAAVDGETATSNFYGAQGTPRDNAVVAFKSAGATGVPPELGMTDPEMGRAAMTQQQGQAVLDTSVPVRNFAATSPAHVAATQEDWPTLAKIGEMTTALQRVNAPPWDFLRNTANAVRAAVAGAQAGEAERQASIAKGDVTLNTVGGSALDRAAIVGAAVFSGALQPIAKAIYAASQVSTGVPINQEVGRRLLAQGTTEEQKAGGAETLAGLLAGTLPLHMLPRVPQPARLVMREVPPLDLGTVPSAPVPPSGPVPTELLTAHAQAAHDTVAAVQAEIADTKFHTQLPALTEQFLSHTAITDDVAYVDPAKLLALYMQGHTPFSDRLGDISDAVASGREVAIPMPEYLAATSGQPWEDEVRAATRFSEGGVSVEEAKGLAASEPVAAPTPAGEVDPNTGLMVQTPQEGAAAPTEPAQREVPPDLAEHAGPLRALAANVDEAVAQVFQARGLDQLFQGGKPLKLSDTRFDRYDNMLAEAKAATTERVLQRVYKQLRAERKPAWEAAIAQHTASVEQLLAQDKVLQAYSALSRGKGLLGEELETTKLSLTDDLAKWGMDLGLPRSLFRKDGMTADAAADALGFQSGAQMVRELSALKEEMGGATFAEHVKGLVRNGATLATRAELGFDISPEGLMRAAEEEAVLPTVQDFLESTYAAFAKEANVPLPLSVEDVKSFAKATFDALPVDQAKNVKLFERGMWSNGEKTQRALEKGDWVAAFKARQLQLQNFYQLKLSHEFARDVKKGDKTLKGWAADGARGNDPVVSAVLQKTAGELGFTVDRDPAELDRFLEASKAAGLETTVPGLTQAANDAGYGLPETPVLPTQAQDVTAYRNMMTTLNGIAKFGKELREVQVGGQTWEMARLANTVQDNANTLTRKYTAQQLIDARNSVYKRLASSIKSILINNWSPEKFLSWMDLERQGPLMKSVVNVLQGGKYTETRLIDEWIKAVRASVSDAYLRSTDTKLDVPTTVPQEGEFGYHEVPMYVETASGRVFPIDTRGKLRTALLHLGSETARERLLKGFDWGAGQEKWIIDNATAEDFAFARAFWDQNEVLFKHADAMYMRVRGEGLVKDEPRVVYDKDGVPHEGGHVHIKYNSTLSTLRQVKATGAEGIQATAPGRSERSAMDNAHPARALPSAFYGLERTHVGRPVDINPRGLSAGVSEVIHDISFREAVMQAQKVLADPRVKEAIMTTMGPEYQSQMAPWLNYIANDRMIGDSAAYDGSEIVQAISNNFVYARIGYNISSTVKHSLIGLSHITRVVGNPQIVAQASADLVSNGKYWSAFIDQMSGEVAGLAWNLDANLQEALAEDALSGGRLRPVRQAAFYLFAWSKLREAQVTWLAVFRREVASTGNIVDATNIANKAVRETQGANSSVDLPTFRRKVNSMQGAIMRNTVGMLMGFKGTTANALATMSFQLRQVGVDVSHGEFASAGKQARGASGYFASFVIGASLVLAAYEVFVRGGGNARKSKGDAFNEELGWALMEQGPGSFLGLNRIVDMAHYGADDQVQQLIEQGVRTFKTHEVSEREVTGALKLFGGVLGGITDSMVNAGAAGYDVVSGQYPLASATTLQRGVLGRQGDEVDSGQPVVHHNRRHHRTSAKLGHK